jgi:hypothetical protein
MHSQATHFDEEILITMSKSMTYNEQSFFPLSFRILSITTLTAMLLFLSALYLWMQEFTGPFPPQSQVQGTMKGQSIQFMFMEALQAAYPPFAKNLTFIRTDISIANQRSLS